MRDSGDTADRGGFARLLAALDSNQERAGERYVVLRRKLVAFFEWRGAPAPDACADRTLDIAAERMAGGEAVRNVSSYCGGIARFVLLESLRERDRERSVAQSLAVSTQAAEPEDDALREAFEHCVGELPAESRDLILTYYSAEGQTKAETRARLAARLGIPITALRIRAYRVRVRLEGAVRAALQAGNAGWKRIGDRGHE